MDTATNQQNDSSTDLPPSYDEIMSKMGNQNIPQPTAPSLEETNNSNSVNGFQKPSTSDGRSTTINNGRFRKWDDLSTNILIMNCLKLSDRFDRARSTLEIKIIWDLILVELDKNGYHDFTVTELESYWYHQFGIYRSIITNSSSEYNSTWPYFEPMHNKFGKYISFNFNKPDSRIQNNVSTQQGANNEASRTITTQPRSFLSENSGVITTQPRNNEQPYYTRQEDYCCETCCECCCDCVDTCFDSPQNTSRPNKRSGEHFYSYSRYGCQGNGNSYFASENNHRNDDDSGFTYAIHNDDNQARDDRNNEDEDNCNNSVANDDRDHCNRDDYRSSSGGGGNDDGGYCGGGDSGGGGYDSGGGCDSGGGWDSGGGGCDDSGGGGCDDSGGGGCDD